MTMRRFVAWPLACALGWSVACDTIGRAAGGLGEIVAVQRAVQARVGSAPVRINVANGAEMGVSIVNSPLRLLPADQRKAKARELAKVAYDAYASRGRLTRIQVVFVVQSGFLFVTFSDGSDAHVFEPAGLKDGPTPPSATPT
jgi:hypothetical protein